MIGCLDVLQDSPSRRRTRSRRSRSRGPTPGLGSTDSATSRSGRRTRSRASLGRRLSKRRRTGRATLPSFCFPRLLSLLCTGPRPTRGLYLYLSRSSSCSPGVPLLHRECRDGSQKADARERRLTAPTRPPSDFDRPRLTSSSILFQIKLKAHGPRVRGSAGEHLDRAWPVAANRARWHSLTPPLVLSRTGFS